MVERWHRSLKAAIRCNASTNWINTLPVVLLGLRTSFKEDIKASAAEMLYGTTLRLPGAFFIDVEMGPEPQHFVEEFREFMRAVRSSPTAHHNKSRPFKHTTLHLCTHVFVRVDEVKKPLEQPYRGPYKVLERITDFVFKVDVDGNATTISTERLKPAFIEAEYQGPNNAFSDSTALPSSSGSMWPDNIRTYSKVRQHKNP